MIERVCECGGKLYIKSRVGNKRLYYCKSCITTFSEQELKQKKMNNET